MVCGQLGGDSLTVKPVYLLISSEQLLLDEAVDDLRDQAIPPESRDLNYLALYGWDAEIGTVLEFLQTIPFLADRRMLVIREIQKLSDWKKLLDYLKDPNPGSCLVMTSSELRRKDPAFKSLSRHSSVSELKRPYDKALIGWVVRRFRGSGKLIDHELANLLVMIAGSSLSTLSTEVEKVVLHAGERDVIEKADLDASLPGGVETVFSLLDAIGDGDGPHAMICLKRLMESGVPPEQLVYMMARHYRQLLRGDAFVKTGMTPGDAAAKLGIRYPNLQKKFVRQLERAKDRDTESDLEKLSATDRLLKTSPIPATVVMDRLLLDLLV
ncbi:DNA polymerase III subunit delta [bacterium]|nr:MAG: DNA polymerase III subunit delta [bacterium]